MFRMITPPVGQLVDSLPETSITTRLLNALDYLAPGEWENNIDFDALVRSALMDASAARIEAVNRHARALYAEQGSPYQRAAWIFRTIDTTDRLLAATAIAGKVGEKIDFLSILDRVTPKSDVAQAIDLAMKLLAELTVFGLLNGRPTIAEWRDYGDVLQSYTKENAMRIAAVVALDGVLPLGPDFATKAQDIIANIDIPDLGGNPIYQRISGLVPGLSDAERLGFLQDFFSNMTGWLQDFQAKHHLMPDQILGKLGSVVELADDKLDYVGAFVDATTDYFAHTGTQTVARAVIAQAIADVPEVQVVDDFQFVVDDVMPIDADENDARYLDDDYDLDQAYTEREGEMDDVYAEMKARHKEELSELRAQHRAERERLKEQKKAVKGNYKKAKKARAKGGRIRIRSRNQGERGRSPFDTHPGRGKGKGKGRGKGRGRWDD